MSPGQSLQLNSTQLLRLNASSPVGDVPRALDVDIFDEFSVILPRQRKAACTGHYICYKFGRNRTITIQGDVGELSLLLLMEQVSHGIK